MITVTFMTCHDLHLHHDHHLDPPQEVQQADLELLQNLGATSPSPAVESLSLH